jgi:hypothetical protein
MAAYKVIPDTDSGFAIEVVSAGVRHTMLGFDIEADALEWVEADRARTPASEPEGGFSLAADVDD